MGRKTIRKIIIPILIFGVVVILCELICRIALLIMFGSPMATYHNFGFDREPLLAFDMIPGMESRYLPNLQTTYSTNSKGFRGKKEFGPKEDNEVRIAILGGSSAFGWGASSDETTIAYYLMSILNARSPSRSFSVINAASPGYTSYQVLAKIQLKLIDLEPDFLVFYMGWNDLFFSRHKLPFESNHFYGKSRFFDMDSWQNFIRHYNRRVSYRFARSFALTLLVQNLHFRLTGFPDHKQEFRNTIASEELKNEIQMQFYENLTSIAAISHYRKIHPVFITIFSEQDLFPAERNAINDVIKRVARESESTLIDADRIVMSNQITGVNFEKDNYHLTDKGNEFLAGLIGEEICEILSR